MARQNISFGEFGLGSKLIQDLIAKKDCLVPLVSNFYSFDNLIQQTTLVKKSEEHRKKLVDVLSQQNRSLQLSTATSANIESIANQNTFCITTGHQLNLLTGPLYSIYKIAQTIAITKELDTRDSSKKFVPVFWMATEDHDYEEINHINLFGKKIDQSNSSLVDSITGELQTENLQTVFDEIKNLFRESEIKVKLDILFESYTHNSNWAQATRHLINELFGEFGIVIIDGNDVELKQIMMPVFVKEIEQKLTATEVSKTNQVLETIGYHQQVHLRDCNLFFIHQNFKRERIVRDGDNFQFNNSTFSVNQLVELIKSSPEKISPNALLRPVYQELVLPNLAYIGGGGEIAYWLQLKGIFDKLDLAFPVLRVRDSIVNSTQKDIDELNNLGLELKDLNENVDVLAKRIILAKSGNELNLDESKKSLDLLRTKVLEKSNQVDLSLSSMIEAEFSKMMSGLDKIESKLIKTEKQKDDVLIKKLEKLKNKIYPNGVFQERYENFIPYFLQSPNFIKNIIDGIGTEESPMVRILIPQV